VAFALGAAVLALQVPLLSFALTALGGSDAVHATALAYSRARIWSAPFALANYVVLGYLLGVQRVRLALVAQVFINAVNIGAV
ncbi:MATE family efflux transporter, partial [Paraburkholderia sp. SIMBA_050]